MKRPPVFATVILAFIARRRGFTTIATVPVAAALFLMPGIHLVFAQAPLQEAFKRVDGDSDQRLSSEEISRFPQLKTRLAGADTDNDGFVTLAEFRAQLLKTSKPGTPETPSIQEQLASGEYVRPVRVGQVDRRYRVHVPADYDASKPTPVVIAFHGGGGNPESMARLSGLNAKSDEAGFIVVYPYGSGRDLERGLTFNGGECCGYAMINKVDDVSLTRELLDNLATVANVDPDRVFATGLSNGGIMAHYVASELSDRIAAIAPIGGPLMIPAPNAKRPVSVMHFHGTADELAPFKGGYGKGPTGGKGVTEFRSVEHTIQAWVKANGCQRGPKIEPLPDNADDGMNVTSKTWSGGRDGSEVVLVEIEGGGHTWPGMQPPAAMLGKSTKDISANDLMWKFFLKHPRKSAPAEGTVDKPLPPKAALRMKVLRTPESRFANLPGYDFTPHYLTLDDYEGGQLRMLYLDEGPTGAPTVLMLHGNPTWSYLFREVIQPLNAAGYRTIVLDYIGMGRSDKPAGFDDYTYDRHLGWIKQAFEQLDGKLGLGRITIFGHDYGVPFGIRLMAEHYPERFDGFINANASLPVGTRIAPTHLKWRQFVRDHPDVPIGNVISSQVSPPLMKEEIAAWNAPYPDASYKMAIRSFPEMVPDSPDRPEAVANVAAWRFMQRFTKPLMTIFGKFDPVGSSNARQEGIMDLTRSEALKVAFRYLPFGVKDGEGIVVELWDGSQWVCLLKLVAGSDFRNGAEDYGFARVDNRQTNFSAAARIRVRSDTADPTAGVYLLDFGIYTRSKHGGRN
ncbi:MAG: haloalkane dehalogenase [Planctomycetota bacterium]